MKTITESVHCSVHPTEGNAVPVSSSEHPKTAPVTKPVVSAVQSDVGSAQAYYNPYTSCNKAVVQVVSDKYLA